MLKVSKRLIVATLRLILLETGISSDQVFGLHRFRNHQHCCRCHYHHDRHHHHQDTGTDDWISPPEELVARGWSFNVFNISNNLDEQTIAIYTFELQGHHHQ